MSSFAGSENNTILADHQLKTRELIFEIEITANATPADKVHSSDIAGVAVLRTEGKVAEADAIEDLSGDFTTAVDATDAQFGILLDGSKLSDSGLEKVYEVSLSEQTSTGTGITLASATSDYLTSGENIAIDVTATGTSLDSESPRFLCKVVYKIK
jgi:hypothetical protein